MNQPVALEMSPQLILAGITLIVTANSVIVALLAYYLNKRVENRKSLLEQLALYYSPDVQRGIQRLWQLFRVSGNDLDKFLDSYVRVWEDEESRSLKVENQLHYQRRTVTHFWRSLAALLQHGLLPRHIVYKWLAQDDVDIVERFLIALENRIARKLGIAELNSRTDPLYYLRKVKHKFYK